MAKWEYNIVRFKEPDSDYTVTNMDRLGGQGWELVQVMVDPRIGEEPFLTYWKRPGSN